MKKTNTRLEEKLGKYSAMGAAFLLTAPLAQANVQFTDVNPDQIFGAAGSVEVDLDGDAVPDVRIRGNGSINIYATPLNGALLAGSGGAAFRYPFALPYGASISAGPSFFGPASFSSLNYGSSSFGNWNAGTDAYLGVQFNVGPNTHYGYIHLEVTSINSFILKDYAWEDTPGTAIQAGAAPAPVIPTMNQWGKFLYGLILFTIMVVFGYNQKKKKDAQPEKSAIQ